ncbi:cell wall glucanase [Talaromyces pinophilus]|uniref:chitinase n=1 Tax=Talaromyces pinophilus TaxID=128442 RepID=A0A478ECS1_TALPI|nr:cell wall glucanase [Talaromyces pinophilus]
MPSLMRLVTAALATAVAIPLAAAQTYSSCNPLNGTCPADPGLANYTFYTDFTAGDSAFEFWNTTAGTVNNTAQGAAFIINEEGDSPTIQTAFYFFFGHVDVKMKIASGTGIISSIVFLSDDLDEIDWEGIGTYNYEIETNYFGKDNTTSYDRATYPNVTTPCDEFHTYSVDWTPEQIQWFVDGDLKRTLAYDDALSGENFPQTPMVLKLGIWAGGDSSEGEGTIEWAGGETDFSDAPFTMYVESVNITNYYPAESYTYSDTTGAYTSIVLSNSTSTSNSSVTTSTTKNGTSTTTLVSNTTSSNTSSSSASASSSVVISTAGAAAAGLAMSPVAVVSAVVLYLFM